LCQCDCGNEAVIDGYRLRSGSTQSCGCLQRERTSKANLNDLTGQRFGRLLVTERAGTAKGRHVLWACACECGGSVDVAASNLVRGNSRSCGCIRAEISELAAARTPKRRAPAVRAWPRVAAAGVWFGDPRLPRRF